MNFFFRFFCILCPVLHSKLATFSLRNRHNGKLKAFSKKIIRLKNKVWVKKKLISILAMKSIFLIWHSIVCHDALSFKTSTHHLVQKIEVFKKGWEIGMSGKDFFWKKRNFLNCLDSFLRVMGKLTITIQFFLHEMQSVYTKIFFSTTITLPK